MAADSHKYATTLVRTVGKQKERRKIPRYAVNADSELEEPRVRAKINGRMTDIGLGGCYVDAMMTFPVDTDVHMRMTRKDLKFEADAKVVFSTPGLGMGLAFTNLTAAHRRYLSEWVDELSGTERIIAPPTKSTPLDDEEAGERSDQVALQQLIKVLLQRDVITQSEFEQVLRAIGKQVRNK
jgi:PilZ domain-containing protein